jgi:hypothetical protein
MSYSATDAGAAAAAAISHVTLAPIPVHPASSVSLSAPPVPSATPVRIVKADYGPSPNTLSPTNATASPDPGTVDNRPRFLYFAYGSNLLPSILTLKRVHVHSSRRGILRDVQLLFDLPYASLVEPSFANLKRHPAGSGHAVHGVLYEMEARDMEVMDRVEGNGRSYVREAFTVELYPEDALKGQEQDFVQVCVNVSAGGIISINLLPVLHSSAPAAAAASSSASCSSSSTSLAAPVTLQGWAYICHEKNLGNIILKDTPPSRRYLDVLVRGAKYHHLRDEYISWLDKHDTTPLPTLKFTPEQLATIESRRYTLAEMSNGCWKDYMELEPDPAKWPDPLLISMKGVVFDARHCEFSNSWKKFNGGKCLTLVQSYICAHRSSSVRSGHFRVNSRGFVLSLSAIIFFFFFGTVLICPFPPFLFL